MVKKAAPSHCSISSENKRRLPASRPWPMMILVWILRSLATLALVALSALPLAPGPARAQQRAVTIGTGAVTGVYHAAGTAICQVVNKSQPGLRCSVELSDDSIGKINAIKAGQLTLNIVQSDMHYNAVKGRHEFRNAGPYTDLRSVFSLYSEPFTVLARKDAGVRSFTDFKGKRFNVGSPGSATRASVDELLHAMGWTMSDFALAAEFNADDHGPALCAGKIDGFLYAIGHPSGNIREPITSCGAQPVPLKGFSVEKLVAVTPCYVFATIPG
jgi:TRAP transporter TAXI family solute receptor